MNTIPNQAEFDLRLKEAQHQAALLRTEVKARGERVRALVAACK